MSTADLVAVAGFAAMFLMMLMRVPIGVAMALTGVGGFAAIAGWGPALNLLATSPVRTATDYNFSLIPMFILMGVLATASGMSKELFRAGCLARPLPRRPRARHHRRVRRLRRDLRLVGRDRGDHEQHRAARDASRLPRRYRNRRDRGGRHARHPDPAVGRARDLRLHDRAGRRPAVHRRHPPGLLALGMYMATVRLAYGRSLPAGEAIAWTERLASLRGVWAIALLFIAIIGGIYLGVVTPTEAAAAGAFLPA